ncbi:MAG: PKD domain-containing protein [Bacteroidetes bacterium]|nr:PKD domain-containing protein [Bacteroidota bacterium]
MKKNRYPLAFLFCSLLAASGLHAQEICDNGIDDDGDGLVDLNDVVDCPCTPAGTGGNSSFVPNPSFEAHNCLPTYLQSNAGPNDCAVAWGSGDQTSPDYFHLQAPWGVQMIPQPIPDGEACMGMLSTAADGGTERIGTCLLDTLEAGHDYELRVHVAMGSQDISATTDLGVFYAGPAQLALWGTASCSMLPVGSILCPVDAVLLGVVDFAPLHAWQPVTITFTPTTDITAILLGPSCTLPANMFDPNEFMFPYMWVDSVGITETITQPTPAITVTGTWCGHDLVLHGDPGADDADVQWFHEGVALVGSTDSLLHIAGLAADTGTYRMQVTTAGGCVFVETHIAADPRPEAAFTWTPDEGCSPLSVAFTNTTAPALTDQVHWDFGDGTSSTGNDPVHLYTTPGIYDVTLQVTSAAGCVDDTTANDIITVLPSPEAGFTFSPEAPDVFHTEVAFSAASSSPDVIAWAWDFTGGTPPTDTLSSPVVVFPAGAPGEYPVRLIVTNAAGCTDTLFTTIVVAGMFSIHVPNSFTPDGDETNDHWRPVWDDLLPESYELRVFDRWGQVVWSTTDAHAAWDGRIGGQDAKSDVYVWSLRAKDPLAHFGHELLGHVTVLR